MTSNFHFLSERFPVLEKLGNLAESYLYSDPNTCLYKLGTLAETTINYMFELDRLTPPYENTLNNKIKILKNEGLLPKEIDDILYRLRIKRNLAVHEGHDSFEDSKILLHMAHTFMIWFMQTYGDYTYEPSEFILPADESQNQDYNKLLKEKETLVAELENVKATVASSRLDHSVTSIERKKRSAKAVNNMHLSEAETRELIDEQLRRVGWEADSKTLRFSKGTRPQKGRNIAIAEWPTDSTACKWGNADYVYSQA